MKFASAKPNDGKNIAEISWQDGHVGRFHTVWLRCNCRCDECRRTIVGQVNFDRSALPEKLLIDSVSICDEGEKISMRLSSDPDHMTVTDADWLRGACYCDKCIKSMISERDLKFHDPATSQLPYLEYAELDTDVGMFGFIGMVLDRGFAIVKNVPRENGAVVAAGKKMAPVIETIYGTIFDVFDNQSTENVANTTIGLPYHMDQCAYEAAPGIQLLHAIQFDERVEGGNSLLVDVFHVIEDLRRQYPEDFRVLTRVPVVFGTIDYERKIPVHLLHRKTIISVDYDDQVVGWGWNPGIEQTLRVHEEDVEPFFKAYGTFLKLINSKKYCFKFRLQAGEMLVLHNRRMAHSRDEYKTNGGHRRLQGCYVEIAELRSNYVVLGRKLGLSPIAPKIGNCSAI